MQVAGLNNLTFGVDNRRRGRRDSIIPAAITHRNAVMTRSEKTVIAPNYGLFPEVKRDKTGKMLSTGLLLMLIASGVIAAVLPAHNSKVQSSPVKPLDEPTKAPKLTPPPNTVPYSPLPASEPGRAWYITNQFDPVRKEMVHPADTKATAPRRRKVVGYRPKRKRH